MFLSLTGNNNVVPGQTVTVAARMAIVALLLLTGCTSTVRHDHSAVSKMPQHAVDKHAPDPVHKTPVLDLGAAPDLEGIIPRLADKRVVLVGERHNRFDHHLAQLEIIRRLHALHPRLAIGMEAFQQPFQGVLDDYIAGNLSERELLRATEYYQRWKFDFRHYAPILRYAREHQLPVVALNLPAELTRKVGRNGRDVLTAEEQAQLPAEIDRSDADYEKRLRGIFNQHPHNSTRHFDNFLEVQLLWDEGMAEQAADFLKAHPDYTMVILAGSGHVARGSGIPRRLTRRLQADIAIVLNGWDGTLAPDLADFVLLTEPRKLPPAGTFGVLLDDAAAVPTVSTCLSDSPCKSAGLQRGDRFLSIDGEPINDMPDLRLVMWDKQPGDTVNLEISRTRWFSQPQELSYTIELQ